MSKISTYEVAPVPKLADKLIGTSVGGEIENITYNFTLQELLELFLPIIPANNLQGVLDYGNTATQDINLFGTITTTNLDVTDTANLFITYLNEETHIVGSVFDSVDSVGTAGQVLTSTGDGVEWFTLPPIFTPNLQQVLEVGNTANIDILLDANIEALDVSADTATVGVNLTIGGTITDNNSAVGSSGQVLSSTVTGVSWISLPVYSATSPLLFNPATGVFSIQVANGTQGGYLTANDWITFNGKQDAGNYITALTGEATASGPGSASVTLNNASVTGKVLTGLNVTGGNIVATDSILTAFGKVQNQINGLVGGVQYQGVWNANTNTPTLTSSVGTQGHYYIVNVAGTTNLNGITDWQVGDWAIFSGGAWQKVDNTDSVTSVNGFTGAVSLTTDNIPEGTTNLYYLDSRARAALSFAAGSGAYNNTTGVITIPTDNNQILNGAGYITLSSISATSPLAYNNLTGVFSIQQADATHNGYLSSTDWSTFNGKQNYLGGTGLVKSTAGTITYITDNSGNWNTAYNRSIISAAVTGTTTKTLTLNEQDGNTITASWTDLDTGLTSVGVSMPSAFSVANSPLTANGTISVTGAGTTLQYIDGTGALRTFPGLTGYVPYTGATTNVDLGEFGISAGYFQADLTPTGALQVGRMQWNSTDGTMDLRLLGNNVTLQIGQENVSRVVNKSGIDLLEENYQVVRIRKVAEGGAQGQRLAVVLAQGNNENNSTEVIGLVTETINVNQEGFVTSFGEVKEINTTGSLQGETWVDGDILYLSSTVAGALTNVRPVAPNHSVIVGYVTYAHAVHGKIYMAIDTGYELGELHNVYAPSPTANQSIYWNVANSRYQLNTIGGILGYTPANAATTISTTAPLQGGGDLSANRTFSITQSGASTDGYLSSTDWNTFNNKQPAGSYVPTSRQLTINGTAYDLSADRSWSVGTVTSVAALTLGTTGTDLSSSVATGTTTPVITLNVPTASAANRGALSAADWSTFNTKVGGVTATSPLASSGGQTPNITIQQSSGSQAGYLSAADWTTFNNKQAAGNYITSLTGEATATGPGAASVTLSNSAVTAKVLTGINITGGTVVDTDSILTGFGKLQNQINSLVGGTIYKGTWNASTNTPTLTSGVGTKGWYYIVNVAGTTNLDGITDWFVGDWAIFDGTAWQQVDNTDAVTSVNGQTGAVSLTTDNIPEGSTNQYFLNSRARAALSFAAGSGAYNSTTGVITIPTNNNQITNGSNYITLTALTATAPIVYSNTTGAISITQAGTASNGFLSSTDWNTFNNKQPSGTYVNSVTATSPLFSSGGVNPNITIQQATALQSGFLSSADWVTFNNKQATITLTTTGTSGAATLVGATLNIPNYGSALTGYVPYTGATANVDLGIYTLQATQLTSLGQISAHSGEVIIQSAAINNSWVGNNMFYDGSSFKYKANGYAQALYFDGSDFEIRVANTGLTGASITWIVGLRILSASGNVETPQDFTANKLIKSGGTSSQYLMADGSVSTGPSLTGYVPYTGATANVDLGIYTLQATRVAIGGTPYPNVGYTLKGTLNGNNDTWGVYQGALTHAPNLSNSFAVGYQAGGSVNTGTYTGLSYRGFYQENLGANTGTGTLQTAYGIYIDSLTRGVYNYSAYFAQNVGIGTATPVYLLDVAGTSRFYASQVDLIANSTSTSQFSRLIFQENGTDKGGIQYINSTFATTARRNKLEVFNGTGINFVVGSPFASPDVQFNTGASIFNGTVTASISALATASNAFVVSDGGTLKFRTAAQVLSDIGGQASGNYVTTDTTQSISGLKTFTAPAAGGTGDYTNLTSYSFKVSPSSVYWRIPFLSNDAGISGVFNFETGKNVYWGEPSDTGIYYFRGRTMNIQGLTGTTATFSNHLISNSPGGGVNAATFYDRTGAVGAAVDQYGTLAAYSGILNSNGDYGSGASGTPLVFKAGAVEQFRISATNMVVVGTVTAGGSGTNGSVSLANQNGSTEVGVNIRPNQYKNGSLSFTENAVSDRWVMGIIAGDNRLFFNSGSSWVGSGTTVFTINSGSVTALGGYVMNPLNSLLYSTDGALSYYATTNGVYLNGAGTYGWLRLQASGVENDRTAINLYGASSGSADIIQFRTAALERMVISGSGKIGIGTGSPFSLLHVGTRPGAGTTNPSLGSILTVSNDGLTGIDLGANVNANNVVGHINWVNYLGVGNYNTARIDVYADGAGNSGSLRFWTASVSSSPTIRFTIASTGDATFTNKVTARNGTSGVAFETTNAVNADFIVETTSGGLTKIGTTGNVLSINNGGGNVAVRHSSPQAYLDVMGVADTTNFVSIYARAGNSDDATPESNQILFGYSGSANYSHGIKTRHQSGSQAGNSIEFWVWKYGDAISTPAGQRVMVVEGNAVRIANGSGTINSLSSSERLNVNGTVYATGYYETSDIRLKNVLSTTDGNIPAISYTWKDGRDNKLHWGYAAQDVMKYLPDAVSGSEYYGLDYNQVHTYKIAIIEDEVTILKRRVAELESKLQA